MRKQVHLDQDTNAKLKRMAEVMTNSNESKMLRTLVQKGFEPFAAQLQQIATIKEEIQL